MNKDIEFILLVSFYSNTDGGQQRARAVAQAQLLQILEERK
jgi:hypothetical protein